MDFDRHPCFNAGVRHSAGRVHLPVAKTCNVQCKFCNRNYDCVNESRPGVTSAILSPVQVLDYLGAAYLQSHPEQEHGPVELIFWSRTTAAVRITISKP